MDGAPAPPTGGPGTTLSGRLQGALCLALRAGRNIGRRRGRRIITTPRRKRRRGRAARLLPAAASLEGFCGRLAARWYVAVTPAVVAPWPSCHADGTRQSAGRTPPNDVAAAPCSAPHVSLALRAWPLHGRLPPSSPSAPVHTCCQPLGSVACCSMRRAQNHAAGPQKIDGGAA